MRSSAKVKVMVLDDSLLFREIMIRGLEGDSHIELIGFANDPFEAKDKIPQLEPDVLTVDIEMPRMDGIKFLRRLMPQYPLPVIVVSSLKASVFEAMEAGAIDFVAKPQNLAEDSSGFFSELKTKIIAASHARLAYRRHKAAAIQLEAEGVKGAADPLDVIAIGASTGGVDAINSIITKFSSNMPGIVIVQHMPVGFTALYAKRLDLISNLSVKEAVDGDEVKPGRVLIAPGGFHMTVEKIAAAGGGAAGGGAAGGAAAGGGAAAAAKAGAVYRVRCEEGLKVNGHRPSVDVLFDSVAEAAGARAIGVILTGMGADGAAGLNRIRRYGGYTIGQDERSSVVYGMPMAAYITGAVMTQLPLYRIPDDILRQLSTP